MRISSSQVMGVGIGKKHFVPTINLQIPKQLTLAYGVYAAETILTYDGIERVFMSAVHYGPRPVLKDANPTLETHLLPNEAFMEGYDRDHIVVVIHGFIRDIRSFESYTELKTQIKRDIEIIRATFDKLAT